MLFLQAVPLVAQQLWACSSSCMASHRLTCDAWTCSACSTQQPTCWLIVPLGLLSSSCKPLLRRCISSGLAAHTPASAPAAAARAAAAASSGSGHHTRMPDTEAFVALSSGMSRPHLKDGAKSQSRQGVVQSAVGGATVFSDTVTCCCLGALSSHASKQHQTFNGTQRTEAAVEEYMAWKPATA